MMQEIFARQSVWPAGSWTVKIVKLCTSFEHSSSASVKEEQIVLYSFQGWAHAVPLSAIPVRCRSLQGLAAWTAPVMDVGIYPAHIAMPVMMLRKMLKSMAYARQHTFGEIRPSMPAHQGRWILQETSGMRHLQMLTHFKQPGPVTPCAR